MKYEPLPKMFLRQKENSMIRIGEPVEVKSETRTNAKGKKVIRIENMLEEILRHNRATRRDRDDFYLIRDFQNEIQVFSQYSNKIIRKFKCVDKAKLYIYKERRKHDRLHSARYFIHGQNRKYDIAPIWEYCPILEGTTDELEGYNIYVFVDGIGYLLQVIRRSNCAIRPEDKRHFTKIMQDIVLSDIVCETRGELTFTLADPWRTQPPFEWKVIYPNGRVEEPELFWDMLETLNYKANLDDWGYLRSE